MVKHNGQVAVCGDGQVTLDNLVLKSKTRKVRRLYNDQIVCGVAGATADAFTIMDSFETLLNSHTGNIVKAAVELAKSWRTDKALRRLEAMMLTCNSRKMFLISGNGDVIEPDDNVLAIGSGGSYALAAARALTEYAKGLTAGEIATNSLKIASGICVYTNSNLVLEVLDCETE
jgi:ATP-dependent HslUV protease subunit HslV